MAASKPSDFTSGQLSFIVGRNAAVKEAHGLGVSVDGLAELRRSLVTLKPEIDKQLQRELRQAARPVLARAKALTPYRSGALEGSLRISVQRRGVSLGSRLPYANVIHWGGSIGRGHQPNSPWSGASFIGESLFLSRAIEEHEDQIVEAMGDAMERAAVAAGWSRDAHHRPLVG